MTNVTTRPPEAGGAQCNSTVGPPAQKLMVMVLELVEIAPAHCYDVVDALGIDMRTASATLSELHACGLLIRRNKVSPSGRERKCWVYERPDDQAHAPARQEPNHE